MRIAVPGLAAAASVVGVISALVFVAGCASHAPIYSFELPEPMPAPISATTLLLKSLPGLADFRADAYIEAAIHFQSIGRQAAYQELLESAKSHQVYPFKYVIVCNMLYVPRDGGPFKSPGLGMPGYFLSDNSFGDIRKTNTWKAVPIEIVDGVPFAIATGYAIHTVTIQGQPPPQPAQDYVDYCERECDWRSITYSTKTLAEKEAALNKLLTFTNWASNSVKDVRLSLKRQLW